MEEKKKATLNTVLMTFVETLGNINESVRALDKRIRVLEKANGINSPDIDVDMLLNAVSHENANEFPPIKR